MNLEVSDLDAGYAGATVVHKVTLSVAQGEKVALLGPNGAGKSTLLAVIGGLLRPMGGTVIVGGQNISGLRKHHYARAGIRWVGDPRPIYSEMSVEDNLLLGGFVRRKYSRSDLSEMLDRFPELGERRGVKAGGLSGGQAQILAIAQALMSKPTILLLDEPSMGLAVGVLDRLGEIVASLSRDGVTVIWAEQFPDVAVKHCESVVIMSSGYATAKISTTDLEDDMLERAYLGSAG
jgi:branched-chain amino acid transport system ATP-binding protein